MTGSNSSRRVPIHKSASPRKSCNDWSRLACILRSCPFLTASYDNLLASRSDPLGYLSPKDGKSIQQQIDRAQKMASGLCVLSAVGKSETPSTFDLILAIQRYAHSHNNEANVLSTLDRSLSKQNRIAELVRAQL